MTESDYLKIAPRCGSQHEAFEELCCQLARRTLKAGETYERFRGAGGDGGLECKIFSDARKTIGWQAKFIFEIGPLITQASQSLDTALCIHPDLKEFILCFPFTPTSKTGRKTRVGASARSQLEKLNDWASKRIIEAKSTGREIQITFWSGSELTALLLEKDLSGGLREYFFNDTILSPDWFGAHIQNAAKSAEPRYSPQLSVTTPLYEWFQAFEGGAAWKAMATQKVSEYRDAVRRLEASVMPNGGTLGEKWPTDLAQDGHFALNVCKSIVSAIEESIRMPNSLGLAEIQKKISEAKKLLRPLTTTLSTVIDDAYGNGSSTSKPFRTFMAERMAIFPTESLDATNNAIEVLQQTENWTESAVGKLGFHQAFILTGDGGSGKTHGICDMALRRLSEGAYSCVLFGHQFGNEPVDWERFSRELGLSATLKRDTVWDALDAAAEASGKPLIIWIDAINETKPRKYWKERLKGFAAELCRRPNLKLCVSCRTTFERACIPTHHDFPVFKHNGFRGLERKACREFFGYYGLTSPVTPLLQPELVNPLYLKLVCETLRARGMKYLPPGWHGLAPVITAFLETKDEQFADEHELSPGAKIVSRGLHAVASAIASSNGISLLWPDAEAAVATQVPNANQLKLLDWMIRADLLIEDELVSENMEVEVVLRPAFERLGDFLIASGMIPAARPESIQDYFDGSIPLQTVFRSSESIIKEPGLVAALSVVLAERYGVELPMLIRDQNVRRKVRTMSVEALPWRTPLSFSNTTKRMLNEQFAIDGFVAMEAVLAVSTLPSVIDVYWILRMHSQRRISQRDPFWCDFLHQSYVDSGVVNSLIVAADDLPFEEMNADVALRWSIILCLFTAAADRRIKDGSTRALTQLFKHCPSVIESTLTSMKLIDDDDIIERSLTAAYGALLINKNRDVIRSIAGSLLSQYQADPSAHQHALIRDLIRCIGEMAEHFECLNEGLNPRAPSTRQRTQWKPMMPTECEWKLWCEGSGALYKAAQSCSDDDFNHYTIGCLSPWIHKMDKVEIGRWLVKHLVDEFDFDSPDFDYYDKKMTREHGGGRSKPVWAERIGKKYQWTALFRLASRLHDKFPVKADSWGPKTVRRPLILQEERNIDPTIPNPSPPRKASKDCWWIPAHVNLAATEHLSFKEWLGVKDDLPSMEDFACFRCFTLPCLRSFPSYPFSVWAIMPETDWQSPRRKRRTAETGPGGRRWW